MREQAALKDWAEAEDVGVNVIVVSVLEEFFKRIKRSKRSGKNYDWGFVRTGNFYQVDGPGVQVPRKNE